MPPIQKILLKNSLSSDLLPPISIRPKATKEGGKQESIDRHYWLPAVGGDVPSGTITGGVARGRIMAITERTSFDLDKKVWDSGLGLSAWLADLLRREQALPSSAQELRELLLTSDGLTAVELGAGVGVVSLLLAAMLEPFPTCQKRHLLATDLSSAVPLIEQNVAANCHHFESSMVEAATLDWEAPISACASLEKLDRLDLVIMSDVTYNRDVFPALLRILIALLHLPEASTCTRILMGYKERDPAERDLWELAKNAEIEFENVPVESVTHLPSAVMNHDTPDGQIETPANVSTDASIADILPPKDDDDVETLKRKYDAIDIIAANPIDNSQNPAHESAKETLAAIQGLVVPTGVTLKLSPDYFFEDGNIVLLVYDTFFKASRPVHRTRLCSDGSIFSTMFSLPQMNPSNAEGTSMERPIKFVDKPRRFHALLWALYALPAELRQIGRSSANCLKLIDIATAAQKYAFKSTEQWALESLVDLVKNSNSLGDNRINPWRIFALATFCGCDPLRQAMIKKVKERAAAGKLLYSWVLSIGEALDIGELLADAYYQTVIKDPEHWNEDGKLTDAMVQKLYVGFCKLVTFKDTMFMSHITIVPHECPLDVGQCRARWNMLLRECEDHHPVPSVDVLGQMRAFSKYLRHW
ncbi:hypothetical protein FRB99_008042 [Tulasnella sp. 403]|nr:hypothetical protein FRB99_008042 [Tulasnella sp. 403]